MSRPAAGRPARFLGVSVVSGILAQAGLLLAYGVFGWTTTAASLFSLAVSVGPSYWGSRTYVWPDSANSRRREGISFVLTAVLGTAAAIVLTAAAAAVALLITSDRALLSLWVSAGSVLATVVVWLARYLLLDRLVFPRATPPGDVAAGQHALSSGSGAAPVPHAPREGPGPMPYAESAVPVPRLSEGDQHFDVSIVLPCYNEEASVGLCVAEAYEALAAGGLSGEVLVVDNNCTDRSAELARAAGARVVPEPVPGYGAAIRRGISAAQGRVVVMADADCTYALDRVAELVRPVLSGEVDLCLGSRLSEATRHSMPFLHRFVGTPTLTLLVRQGGGYSGLTDSQSGFRAFDRSAVNGLRLRSTGMEFASEMLLRASQAGWAVREVPLGYRERVGDSKLSTWRDGTRHLRLILKLSPYQLLWVPGIVLTALATLLYAAGIVAPTGFGVGSVTWQPTFFASICLVLGVTGTVAGAVVGFHLPHSSASVRHRYRAVGSPRFAVNVAGAGLAAAGAGLLIDGALLVAGLTGAGSAPLRLTLAGLGQGLIITGAMLAVFALLYRLLLELRDAPVAEGVRQPADLDPARVAA